MWDFEAFPDPISSADARTSGEQGSAPNRATGGRFARPETFVPAKRRRTDTSASDRGEADHSSIRAVPDVDENRGCSPSRRPKGWLMDEGMEASATMQSVFGMRIFDAGEFHVGFATVAPSDGETTNFSIQGVTHDGRPAFPHSLAATPCGDILYRRGLVSPEVDDPFRLDARGPDSTTREPAPLNRRSTRVTRIAEEQIAIREARCVKQ